VDGDIDLENKVIAMPMKVSIKDMLGRQSDAAVSHPPSGPPPRANGEAEADTPAEPLPFLDDLPLLPGPGEPYRAFSRPLNRPLPTLVLVLANASARGFSYGNLETVDLVAAGDPGQGPVIVLRFSGTTATEVELSGRHLDALYMHLGGHRIAWIRERSPSRDFIPAAEAVITGIRITKVEG
jgi:hypothetical protein